MNHQEDAPVGIVLGSGLGPIAEAVEPTEIVPYTRAGVPTSKVAGHAGRFIRGHWQGRPVIIAQGRVHLYEGWNAQEVTASIRWLAEQGVKGVILTNAAGSLHPDFTPGGWMMIEDHLNLTGQSPCVGKAPYFVDMSEIYDSHWRQVIAKHAAARGLTLHSGVYAGLVGPQYETPAEIRMMRTLGADAVGMSTVLEAIQARVLGLRVAGLSCLTNWGAGLKPQILDHHDVLAQGTQAAQAMIELLGEALGEL